MFAHILCGVVKSGLNGGLSICCELERRANRSPEPAHFRDVRHHFSLFDANLHLLEERILLIHFSASDINEGMPIGFASFMAFRPSSEIR